MTLYVCRGSSPIVAVATHTDEQIWIDPAAKYGQGAYFICDYGGPPPVFADDPVVTPYGWVPPTWTDKIETDSIKLECRRRITVHASDQAQRNMNAHINQIQLNRMTQSPARPPTPAEQADQDTYTAIMNWIQRPNGMQATCDALIAAHDHEFFQDVKWPPWNSAWDTFVARF